MRPAGASSSIRGALWATDSLRPAQLLTIAEALQEIALVALDASEGRRALEPSDRRSFACDIGLALAHVGPALRAELGQDLQSVKKAVADARGVLQRPESSEELYLEATALERRLSEPRAARGALMDLFRAVDDGAAPCGACVHCARQLMQAVQRQGRDWEPFRRALVDWIDDGRELALDRIMSPPVDDTVVVWLIFANAVLNNPCRVGPVQFFNGETPRRELMTGSPALAFDGFEQARELTAQALDLLTPVRVREHVLARVELTGPRALTPSAAIRGSNVTDWARSFVSDVISAATFRFGGSRWRLLDGAIGFTKSGTWYGSGFHDPRERVAAHEWSKQSTDPTPAALAEMGASVLRDLAEHRPPAYHAVEEARWHHGATATADIAQRVALRIRGFERMPPAAPSQTWQDTLFSYLSGDWAMDNVGQRLVSAGFALRGAVEFPAVSQPSAVLTNADHAIYSAAGAQYEVNTQAVIQHAEAVAAEFSPSSGSGECFGKS
jgi:hypothetical protein